MKLIFTLVALCFSVLLNAQKAGTLDKSFGDTGVVMGSTYSGECRNLLIQTDGKIISTGTGGYNNIGGFLVVRYNKDGSTDLSFGDSGRVATTLSQLGSNGGYSALQPDGKIVVTGIVVLSGVLGQSVALIRYNTDGSLDNSFGNNGTIINDLGSEIEDPSGILIQPDGKIVITGSLHNYDEGSGPNTIYILRYNTDGSLDAGFAKNGVYKEASLDPLETAGAALQPDGKILLGGDYEFSREHAFFIKRYMPNGTPDNTFSGDGEATYGFGDAVSHISSIYLQDDGKIVAAGSSYSSSERNNATLVRFNADGSADNSFGTLGLVTTEIAGYSSEIKDITEQTNHKILIAGNKFDSSTKDSAKFTLIRYLENGAIDSSFGTSGITITDLGFNEQASSIALQNDNKIVLGGYLFKLAPPYYFVTLARYNNDDKTKKQIIVQKIKRYIQTHNNAQATTLNTISIYPNPAQNILHVEGLSANAKLTVVGFAGNIAISQQLSANSQYYNLNIASLHAGNYLLKIETNGEVVTKQFVKE